jgi:hypothetical protein
MADETTPQVTDTPTETQAPTGRQVDGVVVYRTGWNRNGVGLHADSLIGYAAGSGATPILYEHDSGQILGVSRGMYAEGDALRQDMTLDHPLVERLYALGIEPRYSIRVQRTEATRVICSECGHDMLSMKCEHYPGQVVDGRTVMGQITSGQHAETSITLTPAVPGTGLRDDGLYDTIIGARLSAGALAGIQLRSVGTELERMRGEIATYRHQDARRFVRSMREAKGLCGDEESLLALYEKDPQIVTALWTTLPDSALTKRVTGAPSQPPMETRGTMATLDSRVREMHERTGKPLIDCWRECRKETT